LFDVCLLFDICLIFIICLTAHAALRRRVVIGFAALIEAKSPNWNWRKVELAEWELAKIAR
jgi:hypothetical protein